MKFSAIQVSIVAICSVLISISYNLWHDIIFDHPHDLEIGGKRISEVVEANANNITNISKDVEVNAKNIANIQSKNNAAASVTMFSDEINSKNVDSESYHVVGYQKIYKIYAPAGSNMNIYSTFQCNADRINKLEYEYRSISSTFVLKDNGGNEHPMNDLQGGRGLPWNGTQKWVIRDESQQTMDKSGITLPCDKKTPCGVLSPYSIIFSIPAEHIKNLFFSGDDRNTEEERYACELKTSVAITHITGGEQK